MGNNYGKTSVFTVDSDELISLRDFGYLLQTMVEDANLITVKFAYSNFWFMEMRSRNRKTKQASRDFGYKANEVMETIIVNEDMRVGDSILHLLITMEQTFRRSFIQN